MNLSLSKQAEKDYKKLSSALKKKTDKQFGYLLENYRHPSLRSKKMSGSSYFEARIDYHYRFVFSIENETIKIASIGPHNEGLGKK